MSIETNVAAHYAATTDLLAAIEAGLTAMGKTPSTVGVDDLGPVDEFHIGGRPATVELCDRLGVTDVAHVLDIGCGIGGTPRLMASTFGCKVTGLDLTPEYVEVARVLTNWTGLDDRVGFEVGSALDMPFDGASFDAGTMLHVGMNISDKQALFAEIRRVLRPGARFGVYDVMRTMDGEITFPVPWSTDGTTSFVAGVPGYETALGRAGFEIETVRNRRERALEFFTGMRRRNERTGGPPPLGLHLIIGSDTPQKVSNMIDALTAGTIAPVEIICRASTS